MKKDIRRWEFPILGFTNYDGDTFNLLLDLGFRITAVKRCRIFGIDTPELKGGSEETRAAALLAKQAAEDFVRDTLGNGGTGAVFVSMGRVGKYGRHLGDIKREVDGELLSHFLMREKFAVPYSGQGKESVTALHQANFLALQDEGAMDK